MTTVLFCTQTRSWKPAFRRPTIVPSSCQGVVFADGNGKCQEMLSLRIVVADGSRYCFDVREVHEAFVVVDRGLGLRAQDSDLRSW